METKPDSTKNTVATSMNGSIAKAIQLLNSFSAEKPRLRLREISELTGISQPTAYRMLNTLKQFNLVTQEATVYSLGVGFLKYESLVLNSMPLRRLCMPHIEELAVKERVNVNLAILEGDEVLYIARAETPYCQYGYFHVGMRRPLYCTGLGKVLVCQHPELIRPIFAKGITKYTLNTITDENIFLEELKQVALQGYATDLEEWRNGGNCIAVPIYGTAQKIIAGISISGPTTTYTREKILSYRPVLLEYANRLSVTMNSAGDMM